jgi:hypothetical protein
METVTKAKSTGFCSSPGTTRGGGGGGGEGIVGVLGVEALKDGFQLSCGGEHRVTR